MIHKTIENWHKHLNREFPGGLDELLHDDCVFFSPIVYSPQNGKAITKMYLGAASNSLGGDSNTKGDASSKVGDRESKFRYTKEVIAGNHAVLEFETEVDGKYANGVDIITVDDEGKIIEFKVMMRPLQAIQAVHASMAAMLEKMKG